MIWVSRFDGTGFVLNAELVAVVEGTPDTVVTLTNGDKFIVRESVEQVVDRVMDYHRLIHSGIGLTDRPGTESDPRASSAT